MKRFFCLALLLCSSIKLHSQTYDARRTSAQHEYNKGNFKKAFEITSQTVKEAEQNKKVGVDELLSLKSENACYMAFNDKYDESMKLFDALFSELSSAKPATKIRVKKNYATALTFLGAFRDALVQFEQAYEILKTTQIEKDEHMSLLSSLGQCCQFLYDFKSSEKYFKEGVDFGNANGMGKTLDQAVLYSCLGLLYKDMLLENRSLDTYATAEQLFSKQTDTMNVDHANFLLDYAGVLADVSQFDKALSCLFRTRNLHSKLFGENSPEYAVVLNNIGNAYSKMNKISETEQYYKQSIELKKRIPAVKILSYLNTQNNLMVFYNSVGRTAESKEMAAEIERGLRDPKLEDTLSRGTFAQNLGVSFTQYGQRDKALIYFNEAIKYYDRIYGPGNELSSDVFLSMSLVCMDLKDYEKGTNYLQKAVEGYTPAIAKADANAIMIMCNIVGITNGLNVPKMGEPLIDQAIELAKAVKITDDNALELLYITKAENSADLKKITESIDYFNKYLELKYSQIEAQFNYMTENEKLAFVDKFERNVKNYYAVALTYIEKYPQIVTSVLNFRLRSKGLLLNNVAKIKRKITQLNDPVLNKKFESLRTDRENITKLMNLNTNEYPDALDQVEQLKKEADVLEKEISLKVSDVNTKENITWETIQRQLKEGEVAIEIIRSNLDYEDGTEGSNYSYIIIPSKGNPFPVVIDRKLSWEEEVLTLYRTSINDKKNEPDLYRRLWKHVNDKLTGITSIFVSPDGIYNQVNLNTLLNGETSKFVIEEKNIHYITTLKDLAALKQTAIKKPGNATLVGNPTFDYDLTKLPLNKQDFGNSVAVRGAYGFKLEQLPGTKTEVETIKTLLDNAGITTTLLTEEKANESAVKKIGNTDLIHFATHGFFLEDFSDDALAEYSRTEQEYFKNPMMRSGIFFAGANNTYSINTNNINSLKDFEDGTLTAFEAMDLDLDKTELVVLSACQTGLGKIKNGEGVFGLQRAFKLAGAKSIIMSLWPVSDDATKELMINFYQGCTKSGDLYTSFKNAQLEVKKKFPDPYYWGAFVLNGK
jgi:CHAT domain-containing protein